MPEAKHIEVADCKSSPATRLNRSTAVTAGAEPVFLTVDPISDKFPSLSTYNYASNSPIVNVNLHGLQAVPAMFLWNYVKTTDTCKAVTAPKYNYDVAQQQYNSENNHVAGLGNVDGNFGNQNTKEALGGFAENAAVAMNIAAGGQTRLPKAKQFSFTSPRLGRSKLLNETGSITNLRADGTVDFDDFNSGQGFSGVYDEGTDAFVPYQVEILLLQLIMLMELLSHLIYE